MRARTTIMNPPTVFADKSKGLRWPSLRPKKAMVARALASMCLRCSISSLGAPVLPLVCRV